MQRYLFLIILSTICTFFLISVGCGGGNGITQPSSITNQNNNNANTGYGSIYIKVIWPKPDTEGKFIISSGDSGSTLTASMPYGTTTIHVDVFEYTDPDNLDDQAKFIKDGDIIRKGVEEKSEGTIDAIPAVKVTIKAQGYHSPDQPLGKPIYKPEVQIKAGMNPVEFNLGDEKIGVKATPEVISLKDTASGKGTFSASAIEGESEITARIVISSPDITPVPTSSPPQVFGPIRDPNMAWEANSPLLLSQENNVKNNTLESLGDIGLEHYKIKFTIEQKDGWTLTSIDGSTNGNSIDAYTDKDGWCSVKLKTTKAGTINVTSECELISGDPNSVIDANCPVTATDWVYWSVSGHYYKAVATSVNWPEAKVAAEQEGGYLACISSEAENNFVFSLIDSPAFWMITGGCNSGPWLGGYQPPGSPEPDGGWTWVSGHDTFVYSNWNSGEPNNQWLSDEYTISYVASPDDRSPFWNDVYGPRPLNGYIIERDTPPTY